MEMKSVQERGKKGFMTNCIGYFGSEIEGIIGQTLSMYHSSVHNSCDEASTFLCHLREDRLIGRLSIDKRDEGGE